MSKRFPFLLDRKKSHIGGIYQYGSISVSILESIYGGGFRGFPPQYRDRTKKKERSWDGFFSKVFGCGNFGERLISLGGGRFQSLWENIISRNNILLPSGNLVLPPLLTFLNL